MKDQRDDRATKDLARRRRFLLIEEKDEKTLAAFREHRPLLFSIAYRMLGSVSDAEDVVQDAYLRWQGTDAADVRSPGDIGGAFDFIICHGVFSWVPQQVRDRLLPGGTCFQPASSRW